MLSSLEASLGESSNTGPPPLIYGTAWKKERTAELVEKALLSGFRALDTAPSLKHYREDLAGEAVRKVIANGSLQRHDIYIQTKFTDSFGEDPADLPYDFSAPIADQVRISIKSSLFNLRETSSDDSGETSYIDCLILHSPLGTFQDTLTAWTAMEEFVPNKVRHLGLSNTNFEVLRHLYNRVRVKPTVIQNRFYPETAFDVPIRAFCRQNDIVYECYWTLKKNAALLAGTPVTSLSTSASVSREVALYFFILNLGSMSMLNGTTDEGRMTQDLAELDVLSRWADEEGNSESWADLTASFKNLVDGYVAPEVEI